MDTIRIDITIGGINMIYSLIFVCALGQVDELQSDKDWLILQLMERGFKSTQIEAVQQRLNRMTPAQIQVVVESYKAKQQEERREVTFEQQKIYNQAVANLEAAKAYRDYLANQYQQEINSKREEVKLMRQQTVWTSQNLRYGYYYRPYNNRYRGGDY